MIHAAPLQRLLGLETEYAIRFAPEFRHPGNDIIFEALRSALGKRVATRPGTSAPGRDQFFTENGGAFYYEYLPHCLWGGLIEGATPECRGPGQLLLYQQAQEALLREALPVAERELAARGFPGTLGLLKNSRDAEGHIYGSQENYEADIARGFPLLLYRLGLVALLPILLVHVLLTYAVLLLLLLALVLSALAVPLVPPLRRRFLHLAEDERGIESFIGRLHMSLIYRLTWPVTALFSLLLRFVAFRRVRQRLLAFLVTRPILTGSGSTQSDDPESGGRRFGLSEKGQAIRKVLRFSILPEDRPIFDTGNLVKMLCAPFNFQLRPILHLFRKRQRLQLGYGDSNRAQVAEYLRVATTALLLDLIDDDALDDAPRLADPVAALHTVVGDPTLTALLPLADGTARTALEIQRYYLEQAKAWLRAGTSASMEARRTRRIWQEALDALAGDDPGSLIGRLDWVTKRYLLEHCARGELLGNPDQEAKASDDAILQTIDLRYHELGEGYFARLEAAGEAVRLVQAADVRRAMRDPPEGTPAFLRGDLIRRQRDQDVRLVVSWDSATLGRRFGAKVIPFRRPSG